ncbi:hypothetical protein Hanom_Chr08g00711931 [Helianthus anomalus]
MYYSNFFYHSYPIITLKLYFSLSNYFFRVNYKFFSFMFVSNYRQCQLPLNLTSFVVNVSKSCTLCPLTLTQSDFFC